MTQEIKKIVDEMHNDMQKEITNMQEIIVLLENFDENASVTPEQFQLLCNTPLRRTKLLEKIAQNTFPMATNVYEACDYVCMNLYTVPCMIPKWNCKDACIEMSWWQDFTHCDASLQKHRAQELINRVYPILQKYSGDVMQYKNGMYSLFDIEAFKQEWESSELYQEMIAEQEERE